MNSFDSVMDSSHLIETELQDILTLNSCTALISELIKFILYRKQQLPYTFDRLKYLISKRHSKVEENKNIANSSVEKEFKIAEDRLATLEMLFEKTKEEFANSKKGHISEVALLFGSTPMTPKQVYRIHLPQVCLDHSSANHPEKKHLLHLLQTVVLSNNLSKMLTKPMNPTNMYVLIKKKNLSCQLDIKDEDSSISNWFTPKNRYQIPKSGQHFHIKFRHPQPNARHCSCENFKVYSDDTENSLKSQSLSLSEELNLKTNEDKQLTDTEWYQACAIFKGFTDVYVNGVSVADLWLR